MARSKVMHEKNEYNQCVDFPVADWSPRDRPAKSTMHGNYCVLEPLHLNKHALALFEALQKNNQGETWTYLPYGPFDSCDDFRGWLHKTMKESDTVLYVILDAKTKQTLGISGYLRINPDHGVIEVGHLHFSKLLQRTPAATEAMYLMMRHAFDDLGYRRYEWKCNSFNEASRVAAQRLGFKFEGIFRQSNVFKNRNRDTAWFSILDTEWPELKVKFHRWLSSGNFDENGKQKQSLGSM